MSDSFRNFFFLYFRVISTLITTIITTCIIWIPVTALVCYILVIWVRRRGKTLLPHLRQPGTDGKAPIVIGFFHPYCNAGGGGERVLWVAIRALQKKYTNIRCVVYTGDTEATGAEILAKSHQRFNISLPRTGNTDLEFVFLNRRKWVEASPYPFFTLLGQSVGSLVLGFEALLKFVPDVYLDTMGYAFTIPLFKYMGGCTVGCYVHYPTISTDMLQRVSDRAATYNNAGFISQSPILSSLKLIYYKIFAYMYGVVGKRSHVVMVNSSWTKGHIMSLWQAKRYTHVLYPPCDTREFMKISLREDCDKKHHTIVSIAQFRPEKDHQLQIRAFHKFLTSRTDGRQETYELLLVGSCRNAADSERVVALRKLCDELELADSVKFRLNVSFEELKQIMTDATIGLHTMWNEHFGIGVVELMAAGTIILAHDSGGPKLDIVVPHNRQRTGYLASDVDSYAESMRDILSLTSEGRMKVRLAARESVLRFSEQEFESGFLSVMEPLIERSLK